MNKVKEDLIRLFSILLGNNYSCTVLIGENITSSVVNKNLSGKPTLDISMRARGGLLSDEETSSLQEETHQLLRTPAVVSCYIQSRETLAIGSLGDNVVSSTYSCQLYVATNNLLDIINIMEYNMGSIKYKESGLLKYVISLNKDITYNHNGLEVIRFSLEHRQYLKETSKEYPVDSFNINPAVIQE